MSILRFSVALLLACSLVTISNAQSKPQSTPQSPLVESYLRKGESAVGVTALRAHLAKQPTDAQAQFGLGVVEFFSAVETLGQSFHRHGLRDSTGWWGMGLPLLRLPVPENANPEPLSYPAARAILQAFIDDLETAEKSLAKVADPSIKLPLSVSEIQLDFVGNGTQPVALNTILQRMGAIREARDLKITFDQADATWLRGYCNLLSAMCEFALAHDGEALFNATAHLFFRSPQSPLPFLQQEKSVYRLGEADLSDLIAFFHLLRLPVVEPERMQKVLEHLEKVLTLSGQMWQQVLNETDDDQEWIPNTNQSGALGVPVTQEMIDSWVLATKEGLEVLKGERLIPFWRGNGEQGINLRRVFTEPTTFDLVLWIQGSAAAPYLENGEMTQPEVWQQLLQVFRGNFVVFAIWFN